MTEPQYYVDPKTGETKERKFVPATEERLDLIRKVQHFKSKGYSNVEIATQLGLHEAVVRSLLGANPATGLAMYAKTFDATNKHWSRHEWDNKMFLQAQKAWCNDRLDAVGHIFLNEIYDMLGFERTSQGAIVGWFKQPGSNPVEFEIVDDDVNGGWILDFNPDGVIYDKLPD